jgi:hypothetical protein
MAHEDPKPDGWESFFQKQGHNWKALKASTLELDYKAG